ncbi:leucine-rich repeat domain-containing protein [Parabacteroides sp. PF5-6]|uniref:leucine-rich repeat domain-containing protein n=1 Tax=Parabacteroides sp. PF5-6 TaxID=1742403 RepID=UPI0024071DF4|nr:leucine-rich repeat domain-containing protein [Parabacteroides sp. PF5-6]
MKDYNGTTTPTPWYNDRESITSVIIKEGVTNLGTYAFYLLSSLTSVSLPQGLTSIREKAFSQCINLSNITLPEGLTSIGNYVFYNTPLTSITIPGSVNTIGDYAFQGCQKLESVSLEVGVEIIGKYAFNNCIKLTSVDIPEGVKKIGDYAFIGCTSLTSITIPSSIKTIGRLTFSCKNLAEFTILNPDPETITTDAGAFGDVHTKNVTLYVPAGSETAYQGAPVWENFGSYLPIPDTTPTPTYHTLTLDVADGIDLYNFAAGNHQIEEGGHLHLQFLPEDRTLTAKDILFLVDGVETEFTVFGGSNYFSYILNPVEGDHTILVALREYTVTLPETEGIIYNVGAGSHRVPYGEKFSFSLTLADGIDPAGVQVFANGIEIQPDALRATSLIYTIDKIITSIEISFEGVNPTSNASLTHGVRLSIDNGQLTIDNETANAVDVSVYTVTGQNVVQLRALCGSKTITPRPGIYLVKAGREVYKVSVY